MKKTILALPRARITITISLCPRLQPPRRIIPTERGRLDLKRSWGASWGARSSSERLLSKTEATGTLFLLLIVSLLLSPLASARIRLSIHKAVDRCLT